MIITTDGTLSCHTILQKSTILLGTGPGYRDTQPKLKIYFRPQIDLFMFTLSCYKLFWFGVALSVGNVGIHSVVVTVFLTYVHMACIDVVISEVTKWVQDHTIVIIWSAYTIQRYLKSCRCETYKEKYWQSGSFSYSIVSLLQ